MDMFYGHVFVDMQTFFEIFRLSFAFIVRDSSNGDVQADDAVSALMEMKVFEKLNKDGMVVTTIRGKTCPIVGLFSKETCRDNVKVNNDVFVYITARSSPSKAKQGQYRQLVCRNYSTQQLSNLSALAGSQLKRKFRDTRKQQQRTEIEQFVEAYL